MTHVDRQPGQTVITQVPVLLFVIAALFSVPLIAMGIYQILFQPEASGSVASLVFGLGLAYLMLEFVARWERMTIDRQAGTFHRLERGLGVVKQQDVPLHEIEAVGWEAQRSGSRGTRREYVTLVCKDGRELLVNNPSVLYLKHHKTAVLLSKELGVPLHEKRRD